jgi:hypothetical protein
MEVWQTEQPFGCCGLPWQPAQTTGSPPVECSPLCLSRISALAPAPWQRLLIGGGISV